MFYRQASLSLFFSLCIIDAFKCINATRERDKIKFLMGTRISVQCTVDIKYDIYRFIKRQQITLRPIDFLKASLNTGRNFSSNMFARVERYSSYFFVALAKIIATYGKLIKAAECYTLTCCDL